MAPLSSEYTELNQNVIVMRHAERIDYFVNSWRSEAARPWDPPLIDAGHTRALSMGQKLRTQLGYPIHRVFVSPFLRCVQTASGVASALSAVDDNPYATPASGLQIDPSKIKASVQYGLCEAFNRIAVAAPPKNGEDWGFNLSEIETAFPDGMVDPTCEQVIPELPQWEEKRVDAKARFNHVIHALADKYLTENLLIISHGEALRLTAKTLLTDKKICEVDYCAYLQLRRGIILRDDSIEAGKFELLTDRCSGMEFVP